MKPARCRAATGTKGDPHKCLIYAYGIRAPIQSISVSLSVSPFLVCMRASIYTYCGAAAIFNDRCFSVNRDKGSEMISMCYPPQKAPFESGTPPLRRPISAPEESHSQHGGAFGPKMDPPRLGDDADTTSAYFSVWNAIRPVLFFFVLQMKGGLQGHMSFGIVQSRCFLS